MKRPVVLLIASLMVGIVVADMVFYRASVAVPSWLGACLWGSAVVVLLLTFAADRWQAGRSIFVNRPLFVVLVVLFFMVVGFARYASFAEMTQQEWSRMERPPVNRGNPDEFDYRRWRWVQGEEAVVQKGDVGSGLRARARKVRERLLKSLGDSGLKREELAVVSAITLGDRSGLTMDTRDLYAAAGASHLLALSGLHLGIIVGVFISLLTTRLVVSRWRWPLAVVVVVFIWGYAFVAGLPPSLVRASLMTSLLALLSCVQRRRQGLNVLLVTVFVMLLVRPVYLFDIGAQLSCLAVAGIILFYQPFVKWCYRHWRFVLFRLDRYYLLWPLKLFAVSVCAQLLTWPLVFYYFHQYPLYGALFSILLVPLTTLLVYGALAVMFLGLVWPVGAAFLSVGVGWLVDFEKSVMQVETSLPGAVIPDFWSRKAEPQLVVYNNRVCPALHLIASPEQSWLLMPQPERADSGMRHIAKSFWKRRLKAEPVVLRGRRAVAVEGMKVVMVDGAMAEGAMAGGAMVDGAMVDGSGQTASHRASAHAASAHPASVHRASAHAASAHAASAHAVSTHRASAHAASAHRASAHAASAHRASGHEVDVLWITSGFRGGRLDKVAERWQPRLLVLDASLARWQRRALRTDAARVGWRVYDVAEEGALRVKMKELKN